MLKTPSLIFYAPFETDATDIVGGNTPTISGATLSDGKIGKC